MAVGESQDCNWAARGWVRSLVFVFFSYASNATLRTDRKLEEEEEEEEAIGWDMVRVERAFEEVVGWPSCSMSADLIKSLILARPEVQRTVYYPLAFAFLAISPAPDPHL